MRAGRRTVAGVATALLLAVGLVGCAGMLESPPVPEPAPFPEIAGQLGRFGVDVESWVSGDAGCQDATLSPTAIRFDASGLDQTTPVHMRIYIFRDRDAWERRLSDVDACATAWATDLATFEIVPISPYVVAGQGPWGTQFEAALRQGLTEAAGTGG
jgi:hypothetical protein